VTPPLCGLVQQAVQPDRGNGSGNLQLLALSFSLGKLVQSVHTKLINLQTVCTEKFTHGLRNFRLGYFIAARWLWAAGYAQDRYTVNQIINRE